ncbi:hypothetical protein E2C01_004580 [Portunus trituberculatus]|uniref:Uncharacterized protein n=1 Tax=Portunus trituberculatus TaxID=210409 RepID=A0A5B7CRR2_PORTR|nr:hypothetical protein [Portunus trituberculatus]
MNGQAFFIEEERKVASRAPRHTAASSRAGAPQIAHVVRANRKATVAGKAVRVVGWPGETGLAFALPLTHSLVTWVTQHARLTPPDED